MIKTRNSETSEIKGKIKILTELKSRFGHEQGQERPSHSPQGPDTGDEEYTRNAGAIQSVKTSVAELKLLTLSLQTTYENLIKGMLGSVVKPKEI